MQLLFQYVELLFPRRSVTLRIFSHFGLFVSHKIIHSLPHE